MSLAELFHANRMQRSQRATPHLRCRRLLGRRKLTPRQRKYVLEPLEPRLLLSVVPFSYTAATAAKLTLELVNPVTPTVELLDTSGSTPTVVAQKALSDTSEIDITGSDQNDALTIAASIPSSLPVVFTAGGGSDTLTGPAAANSVWQITGPGSGSFGGVTFSGVEKLIAGSGTDILDYSQYPSGVVVNLNDGTATGFSSISGFRNVVGSPFADTITGDANDNSLTGGAGANTLSGGDGSDTVAESGDVNFTLTNSTLTFGTSTDALTSIEHATLTGGSGANSFNAGAFTLGSVNLIGGAGNDTYRFDASQSGSFFLDETGGGTDTLDFSTSTTGITINLSSIDVQTVSGNLKITLSAVNVFENAIGGSGADTITGNELDNTLTGGGGNDTLTGGIGDDTYVLGNNWGVDSITEAAGGTNGEGIDTIDFTTVTTDVTVTKRADGTFTLVSGANSLAFQNIEQLAGGTGVNTLDFSASTDPEVVNLAGGLSTDFTSLSGFGNVIGSPFNDTIIGNALPNTLTGGAGDDVISGGGGADSIDGGPGSDQLFESRDVNFTLTNNQLTATGTGIVGSEVDTLAGIEFASLTGGASANVIDASGFHALTPTTPLSILNHGAGVNLGANDLTVRLTNGTPVHVDLTGATSIQEVLTAIHAANPRLTATVNAAGNGINIVDSTADGGDIQASSVSTLAADLGLNVTGAGTLLTGTAVPGGAVTLDGGSTVLLSLLNGGTGVRTTDQQQVDLLTHESTTLLSSLNQGGGVRRVNGADFRITLTDGTTVDVDITPAMTTLQDAIDAMLNAANAVAPGRLSVVVNPDTGNSLLLTDSQAFGGDLKVTPLNGSQAAADLGILRDVSGAVLTGFSISDVSADLRVTLSDGTRIDFDLTGATTLDDVLQKLNLEDPGFSATINTAGTGLTLTDTSGGAGPFTAVNLNGSFAATDLGITAAGVGGTIAGTSIVTGTLRLDGRLDNDTLTGGSGDDTIIAGGGNDHITGGL